MPLRGKSNSSPLITRCLYGDMGLSFGEGRWAACAVHTLDMLQKSAAVGLTGDYHPLLRNLQG